MPGMRGTRKGAGLLLWLLLSAATTGAVEPVPVSFHATDGMRIAADYYAPPPTDKGDAPMVILLHMYQGERGDYKPLVPELHKAGFAVLALDLRGHGESATTETREAAERRDTALFLDMQHDLHGAYDWFVQQPRVDRARVALVGADVGASVALQYAARDRSVDAIVCLSPGLNYMGLDSGGDIHQITGRRLLMVATEDERDAPYTLRQRCQGVQVRIHKEHSAHGTNMFGVVPDLERDVARFLADGVGKPSRTVVYGSINSNIYHEPGSGWARQISASNLRCYSSAREAEARGLRAAKSKGPRRYDNEPRRGRERR